MTVDLLLLLLHELLCGVLLYTVFVLAVLTDRTVRTDVRVVLCLLGAVACLGIPAPLAWGFHPSPWSLLLLAAVSAMQLVTSRHWVDGVPYVLYKDGQHPRRRMSDRGGLQRG